MLNFSQLLELNRSFKLILSFLWQMFWTEFNFFFLIVFINIFIFWFKIITKIKHAGDLSSYIRAHAELTIGLGRFWGLGSARGRRFDPEFLRWTQQKTDYAYGAHARKGPNPYFLEFFFEIFLKFFFWIFFWIFFDFFHQDKMGRWGCDGTLGWNGT